MNRRTLDAAIRALAQREADLRAGHRQADPGAAILADALARHRQSLELAAERQDSPPADRLTLPLPF